MTTHRPKTIKLNDTQLVLLSTASQHPDHCVVAADTITKSAFMRAINALARAGLVSQLEPDAAEFHNGGSPSAGPLYAITLAGLEAIGVAEQAPQVEAEATAGDEQPAPPTPIPHEEEAAGTRPTTKRALVIAMLSRAEGATLNELVTATSWLPHTTRAALTGLRKAGFCLQRTQGEDRRSVYRVLTAAERPQAAL